jgi:hypothetical protein
MENMKMIQIRVGRELDNFKAPKFEFHDTEVFQTPAKFALTLIEKWGMVAAKPDGEDTTGRAKLSLLKPEEVVERAIETTLLVMEAIKKQGWITVCPTYEEAEKIIKARGKE